jgi:hypothetical protein
MFKAVSSNAGRVVGLVQEVNWQLGDWGRTIGFTMVPLDDLEVVR